MVATGQSQRVISGSYEYSIQQSSSWLAWLSCSQWLLRETTRPHLPLIGPPTSVCREESWDSPSVSQGTGAIALCSVYLSKSVALKAHFSDLGHSLPDPMHANTVATFSCVFLRIALRARHNYNNLEVFDLQPDWCFAISPYSTVCAS